MSLFQLLFGFSGRINRAKYWLGGVLWLVFWVIALPACLLAGFYILGTNLVDGELPSGSDWLEKTVHMVLDYVVLFVIFLILMTVSWVSAFAIGAKRLHDRNKSGWLVVLFYLAPSVLVSIATPADQALASGALGLAAFVIAIWGVVELGFLRGTVGPNPYGPDPLQTPSLPPLRLRLQRPAPERRQVAQSCGRDKPRDCFRLVQRRREVTVA
jgi:uncharacterized membrane protein YhaH (DUF805 family)